MREVIRRAAVALGLVLALTLPAPPGARAQEPPRPGQILPPVSPIPRELELPPRVRALVRRIRVVGSTVFSERELAEVTRPWENRELSTEDLEAIRVALTLLYVNRGYVNSGAILPDQTVADGVVTYQVIEGALTGLEIRGHRWFRTGYLRRRLDVGTGPLNVNDLQRKIQLLLEDQRIARLSADLAPGPRPGESTLDVRVEDRQPFRLLLDVNNHQPPSVGAERGIATLEDVNVTGWGDTLALRYGRSDGLDPLLDFRYALPVTRWDTTLFAQYRKNAIVVVQPPFADLDIHSDSEAFTVGVRQPLYRTLNTEVALGVVGERLRHQTTLLGMPFTLLPGAKNGESVVTAVRPEVEVIHRTQAQALAFRSRFSVGVPVLDATENRGRTPDSEFFVWLGQFQWARRLPLLGTQLVLRTDLQLTRDALLTLEQIALGGRFSVRGYRENTVIRDNALIGSLELRVPIVRNKRWADYLELAPFYDYGRGWNTFPPVEPPRDLSSVGLGLRWATTLPGIVAVRPQFEIYWGYRLRNVPTAGEPDRFQDLMSSSRHGVQHAESGLHFQFTLALF